MDIERHARDDTDIRWLAPERVSIAADRHGLLVADIDGQTYPDIQPAKLFALSEPETYVSLRDSEGQEIGILRDLAGLDESSRAVLQKALERRYFIPVIRKVLKIEEFWIDQTWTVITDRGPRQFTVQGRDSVRFLSDRGMLLMDMNDNRYLLTDRTALDRDSQRWVERFVW